MKNSFRILSVISFVFFIAACNSNEHATTIPPVATSNSQAEETNTELLAPNNIRVIPGTDNAVITWQQVPDSVSYIVKFKRKSDNKKLERVAINNTLEINGLDMAVEYLFQIYAVDRNGKQGKSSVVVSAITLLTELIDTEVKLIRVPENQTEVYTITSNKRVVLEENDDVSQFVISGSQVHFRQAPDFENPLCLGNTCVTTVNFFEGSVEVSRIRLVVTIDDVNDNLPRISTSTLRVNESIQAGDLVGRIEAIDDDFASELQNWRITSGNEAGVFVLDGNTGVLSLAQGQSLNYEVTKLYQLNIQVSDGVNLSAQKKIDLEVINNNDNAPVIQNPGNINLAEDSNNNTVVVMLTAVDEDGDNVSGWRITSGNQGQAFVLNPLSGVLRVANAKAIDYESQQSYSLGIEVSDGVQTGSTTINIAITDVDDTAPVITANQEFSVTEDASDGTTIGSIESIDPDSTSLVQWTILSGNGAGQFSLNTNGELSVASGATLDFELVQEYRLTVQVGDGNQRSIPEEITIKIENVNDNNPVISANQRFSLNQNASNGYSLGTIAASDADAGSVLNQWRILPPISNAINLNTIFALDENSGELTLSDTTSLGQKDTEYSIRVQVSDGSTTAIGTVVVRVTEAVNLAPTVDAGQVRNVDENATGVVPSPLEGNDPEGESLTDWIITSGNIGTAFALDATTGTLSVANANQLDYEQRTEFRLLVRVSDGVNTSAEVEVVVKLNDVNDVAPVIEPGQRFAVSEVLQLRMTVGVIVANDVDTVGQLYDWKIISGNEDNTFELGKSSGTLRLMKELDYSSKSVYTLRVQVGDVRNVSAMVDVTVDVLDANNNAPVIAEQSVTIDESAPVGQLVASLKASDSDTETSFSDWVIVDGDSDRTFTLDELTGKLNVAKALDYESTPQYKLQVQVSDGVNNSPTATITVNLRDENDNNPVVTPNQSFSIIENAPVNTVAGDLTADDADSGTTLSNWSITNGNDGGIFAINTSDQLYVKKAAVDYEQQTRYQLEITVDDGINQSAPETVVVAVTDDNDIAPVMTSANRAYVQEGATQILALTATDDDTTGEVTTFSLSGSNTANAQINSENILVLPSAAVVGSTCGASNVCEVTVVPSDGVNVGASQNISITVQTQAANAPPIANPGASRSASAGEIVMLNGNGSSDSDGYITSYLWRQTAGVSVTLNNTRKAVAGFVVPELNQKSDLVFSLTVTDNSADTGRAEVTISVGASVVDEDTTPPEIELVIEPQKESYQIGETLSIMAQATDASGIAKVDFYLDNTLVQTDNSQPYQYIWTTTAGDHNIRAVAQDTKGLITPDNTNVYVRAVDESSDSDALLTTYKLNTENWQRVEVTVTNTGDDPIDIDEGALVYTLPSTVGHQYSASKYVGLSWLGTDKLRRESVETGSNTEHQIIYDYDDSVNWIDSTLDKGESFTVLLTNFAPSQTDFTLRELLETMRFYIPDDLPTESARAQITISQQPVGVDTSVAAVVVRRAGSNTEEYQVSWGESVNVVTLVDGASYEVWAKPIQNNGVLYAPNYTQQSPFSFVADSSNQRNVNVTFNQRTVAQATLSLSFSNIDPSATVNVHLINALSAGANISRTGLAASGRDSFRLLHGDYTIRVEDVESGDSVFVADIEPALTIQGNRNLDIRFSEFQFGPVPGLPNRLLMGSITSSSPTLNDAFKSSSVEVIYKYAGPGGNGDRGQIIDPIATRKTIDQARAAETDDKRVMPMMVVYTAEASGGGWGEEDLINYDNLVKHNINLIRITKALQDSKDKQHPKPGGIILNADFLGVLQQSKALDDPARWLNGKWHGAIVGEAAVPGGRDVLVKRSLQEAVDYAAENYGFDKVTIPNFDSDLFGYFQMQNYIMRSYGPDVIFGWQENLWAIGSSDWAHTIRSGPEEVKRRVSDPVVAFLERTGVYSGLWRPHFLVFDKYERDGFGTDARRDYAYNHNDWNNYLEYVRFVGTELDVPLMLWQIPGGHMPTKTENIINFDINKHAATAAPFLLGDDRITSLDVLHDDFLSIIMNPIQARVNEIYAGRSTAGEYLAESQYDWSQSQLQRAINYGVFAILWGGGSTTSVVPLDSNTGDDDGWLAAKVENYYRDGALPLVKEVGFNNNWPQVEAGVDLRVVGNSRVTLSGSASDSDGAISAWSWSANSGDIVFDNASIANASFTAPKVATETNYTLSLTVTDNKGASATDKLTLTVTPAPKSNQDVLTFSEGVSITGEAETSSKARVGGGSGIGDYRVTSSNSNVVDVAISGTELTFNFNEQGSTSVTLMRDGDIDYNQSQPIEITVTVRESSKQTQATLSIGSGVTSLSGEDGETVLLDINGGEGTGALNIRSTNPTVIFADVTGDSGNQQLMVRYQGSGNADIRIYKESDATYRRSNIVNISASSQEFISGGIEKFDVDVTFFNGRVDITLTNNTGSAIDLRGATVRIKSPVAVSAIDARPVDGSISAPSAFPLSTERSGVNYIISGIVSFGEGDFIQSALAPQKKVNFRFWPPVGTHTKDDFSIIDIRLMKPAGAAFSDLALPIPTNPVNLEVAGWGHCLSMGTVTDSSTNRELISSLSDSKIGSIFKYEGNGFGDRGKIIDASVTQQTIDQARAIENEAGDGRTVMPVMVVYTVEASSGGPATEDILVQDNLYKHFVNLIRTARTVQTAKDSQHPNPGSLILNPDFLGEWLLSTFRDSNEFVAAYGEKGSYKPIEIRKALTDAISYVVNNDAAPNAAVPSSISDDILGFIQAHNFLIRQFAPDVTFGWQQNLWAVGSANWVHNDYSGNQHLWDKVTSIAAGFIDDVGAYSGQWKPDFFVFDKYEFDGFGGGRNNYAYTGRDWKNYLLFVKQMTDHLDTPAMLWQIPGGHMPATDETIINFDIQVHAGSGGTFFMGDRLVGDDLSKVNPNVLAIALDPAVYGVTTVGEYFALDGQYDWGQQQLRLAAYSNVFAILWGGGNTTAVAQVYSTGDDDGWLAKRVQDYYTNGCTPILAAQSGNGNSQGSRSISGNSNIDQVLIDNTAVFNNEVLVYDTGSSIAPSTTYRWNDFLDALRIMAVTGVAEYTFWLGNDVVGADNVQKAKYGLVNIAAFLSQSMKETISYNACDENNWTDLKVVSKYPQFGSTVYPMSSACGQLGQDYASYGEGDIFSCPLNDKMEVSATTNAQWHGAPGPLFAAPDSALEYAGLLAGDGGTGRWETAACKIFPSPAIGDGFEVGELQAYEREECEVYTGQKGGRYEWDGSGKSVQGCGWWGRGVIQTTGRANYGRLNHYLGRTHLDLRQDEIRSKYLPPAQPVYGDLDLCANPQLICSSTEHPDLKWIAGLFYWMSSVQEYEGGSRYRGWNFQEKLTAFVDGGMTDDTFINEVSGIVNRGCPAANCDAGAVDGLDDRKKNFIQVLKVMGLK